MKKLLLTFGALLVVAVPVTTVVACEISGKNHNKEGDLALSKFEANEMEDANTLLEKFDVKFDSPEEFQKIKKSVFGDGNKLLAFGRGQIDSDAIHGPDDYVLLIGNDEQNKGDFKKVTLNTGSTSRQGTSSQECDTIIYKKENDEIEYYNIAEKNSFLKVVEATWGKEFALALSKAKTGTRLVYIEGTKTRWYDIEVQKIYNEDGYKKIVTWNDSEDNINKAAYLVHTSY